MSIHNGRRMMYLSAAAAVALTMLQVGWARTDALPAPLPPQPLADALESFAKQTGLQVVYSAQLAHDLNSPGTAAGQLPEQSLRNILRDTGLTYEFLNERT